MNRIMLFPLLLIISTIIIACNKTAVIPDIKVYVVTGGHGFDREHFFAMLDTLPNIEYKEIRHPDAYSYFAADKAAWADVFLFYDMGDSITAVEKENWINLTAAGKGMIFLHHSLCSFQFWPEYTEIIGGKYHLQPDSVNGVLVPASTYREDVEIPLHIVDPENPVTRGVQDFVVKDEVYGGYTVLDKVTPLITTSHPENTPIVAWTNLYKNSRIVTIQTGHGNAVFTNSNYLKLLEQAFEWVSMPEKTSKKITK